MVGFSTSMMRDIAQASTDADAVGDHGVFAVNKSNSDTIFFIKDGDKRPKHLDRTAFRNRLFEGLRDEFAAHGKTTAEAADLAKQILGDAKIDRPSTDANGMINKRTFGTKSVRDNQLGQVLTNASLHVSRLKKRRIQHLSSGFATDISYNAHHASNGPNPLLPQNVKSTHLKPQIQQQNLSQDVATNVSYDPNAKSASIVPNSKNQPMTQQELQQIVHGAGVTPGAFPLQNPQLHPNNTSSEDEGMWDKGNDEQAPHTPMGVTPNGGKVPRQPGNNAQQQGGNAELQIENRPRPVRVGNQPNRKDSDSDSDEDIWDNPDANQEPVGSDLGNQNDEGIEEGSRSSSAPTLSVAEDDENDDNAGPIVSNITAGNNVEESQSWSDDVDPKQGNTPQ